MSETATSSKGKPTFQREEFEVDENFRTIIIKTNNKGKEVYRKCFQDFVLSICGEIENGTIWVCQLTDSEGDKSKEIQILITQEEFSSRTKYMNAIWRSYPKGNDGEGLNTETLKLYVQFLKGKYRDTGEKKIFKATKFLGYVGNNYWVLSSNDQFMNQRKLLKTEQLYFFTPEISKYGNERLEVNNFLLTDMDHMLSKLSSFGELADAAFSKNSFFFKLVISFALRHLLRIKTESVAGADEPKFGLLYSASKSCGKSTAQKIVAFGLGSASTKNNPFFVGGGNLNNSGTSSSLLRELMNITNLVINVDDIANVPCHIESCIHQLHDGYAQGVKDSGLVSPEAALLFSSNQGIKEKLLGRVIIFPFESYDDDCVDSSCKVLDEKLLPLVMSMKGFLVAWCIWFSQLWEEAKIVRKEFAKALRLNCPNKQPRIIDGWASLYAAYVLFQLTCGQSTKIYIDDMLSSAKYVLEDSYFNKRFNKEALVPLIVELQEAVQLQLKHGIEETKAWLNTSCSFLWNGHTIHTLAIKGTIINTSRNFVNFKVTNLKEILEYKYGKDKIYENVKFVDVEQENTVKKKALRVPLQFFQQEFLKEIITDESLLSKAEFDDDSSQATDEPVNCPEDLNSSILHLKIKVSKFIKDMKYDSEKSKESVVGTPFHETLSPSTKAKFMSKPNSNQADFQEGYNYAMKRLFGNNNEFTVQIDNPLPADVIVKIHQDGKCSDCLVEKNSLQRVPLEFSCGATFKFEGVTDTGSFILFQEQRELEIRPERPSQVFKVKISGITSIDNPIIDDTNRITAIAPDGSHAAC